MTVEQLLALRVFAAEVRLAEAKQALALYRLALRVVEAARAAGLVLDA